MDNSDLPLLVAEMLIEMQELKARLALMETTFFEVRDNLVSIQHEAEQTHQLMVGQASSLDEVMQKLQAVLGLLPQAGAVPTAPDAPQPPVS